MKEFTVDAERLGSVLDRLWEKGEELDFSIVLKPTEKNIVIIKKEEAIASVDVVRIVDDYDLIDELFN